jgi:hypothetical protein
MPRLKSVEDIEIFPLGTKFLVFEDNELVAEIEVEKAWNAKRRREEYKVVFEDYTTVPPARRRAWCASVASAEEKVRRLLEEEFSDAEVWVAYCPWEERVALWGELVEVEKRAVKGGACISEVRARVEVEVCASLQPDGSALIEVSEGEPHRFPKMEREVRVYKGGEVVVRTFHAGEVDSRGELHGATEIERKARTPLSPVEAVRRIFEELLVNYRGHGQYYTPYIAEQLEKLLSLEAVKRARGGGA